MSVACGIRGSGPWLGRRAGRKLTFKRRGGISWGGIKSSFLSGLNTIKNFLVPKIKSHLPSMAETLAKYAVEHGRGYIKNKKMNSSIQAVVDKALDDLPMIVTDLVRRQVDERGSGPETSIAIRQIQRAVTDVVPTVAEIMDRRLIPRLLAMARLSQTASGQHGVIAQRTARVNDDLAVALQQDESMDPDTLFMTQFIESIIMAVIVYLYSHNLLNEDHVLYQAILGSQAGMQLAGQNPNLRFGSTQRYLMGVADDEPMEIKHIQALLPGISNNQHSARQYAREQKMRQRLTFKCSETLPRSKPKSRGGFLPLLVPALAAGVPALATAISEIVHQWTRGSGDVEQTLDELQQIMKDQNRTFNRSMARELALGAQGRDPGVVESSIWAAFPQLKNLKKRGASLGYSAGSKRRRQ